ncbi:DUF309 domain-containing protein [Arsenicitalea aurantiaca]|uniref:DUF309 domain-containing protein n=1 Tax=Arsenicitalea aurantiaca TaxID=1783274 RepID=UPI0013158B8E|nr:DUF309 domain-containing protein [Arsenicitalea aurantiaca]
MDLFNYCYYWEAHEAWEPFWQYVGRTSEDWAFLKSFILLAAAGVKVREGKHGPMRRHLERAASLLDELNADIFTSAIGMSPQVLASLARAECADLLGPSATEVASPFSPADTVQPEYYGAIVVY